MHTVEETPDLSSILREASALTDAGDYSGAHNRFEELMEYMEHRIDQVSERFTAKVYYKRGLNYQGWSNPDADKPDLRLIENAESDYILSYHYDPNPQTAMALASVSRRIRRFQVALAWCNTILSEYSEKSKWYRHASTYHARVMAEDAAFQASTAGRIK